jgi:hypothetical protein
MACFGIGKTLILVKFPAGRVLRSLAPECAKNALCVAGSVFIRFCVFIFNTYQQIKGGMV